MYGFAEGFANRVGAFGEFAAGLRAEVLAPFLARAHFLVVLLANILRAPFVALGRLAPVLALPRELALFLVGEVLAWRQRGRHGWRWWRLHTDVRRTIRRRRWRARWMVDNALEPRLTWKLIVGRPNGTRRTFERSWMALCMIPRPTEGHTTKGCGRWAAIVVRRLPRELALLRGGLRASCETEHPDEEHSRLHCVGSWCYLGYLRTKAISHLGGRGWCYSHQRYLTQGHTVACTAHS